MSEDVGVCIACGEASGMTWLMGDAERRVFMHTKCVKPYEAGLAAGRAEVQTKYDKLAAAVNADWDCLPGCDSYGHDGGCPSINAAARFLDMTERLAALQKRIDDAPTGTLVFKNGQLERAQLGDITIKLQITRFFTTSLPDTTWEYKRCALVPVEEKPE